MKSLYTNYFLIVLSLVVVPYALYLAWQIPHDETLFVLGCILSVVGTLFLAIARMNLGASFAVTPQAKELVTTGLYSKIRHPVYLFAQMLFLGLILAFGKMYILVFWVLLISMQIKRARKEEEVLTEKFGEKYIAYKLQTWF